MIELPRTLRPPRYDEVPKNSSALERIEELKTANIVEGYKLLENSKKSENQQEIPFKFFAEINIDNSMLWDLIMKLANELPNEAAPIFGHDGAELVYGDYVNKARLLTELDNYKKELTEDSFIQWGIIYNDKNALIEVFVSESKYIKFWGVNCDSFRQVMFDFGLNEIEKKVSSKKMTPDEKTELKLDIGKIPEILLDNTDRNRTSPFAFTGNRFEFRAVGASANCGSPMLTLNTVVADQLTLFKKEVDSIINKGVKKDEAIFQVLRKYIIECKTIRFDGNNYSDDWVKEAKKRGLTNINDVPEALEHYVSKQSIDLFKRQNVLSERELHARTEVKLETYTKTIQIESRVLGDLVMNHIVPIAIDYQTSLIKNVKGLKEIFNESEFAEHSGSRLELIKEISLHTSYIKAKVQEMIDTRKEANIIDDARKKADAYSSKVAPFLDDIRYHVDKLEMIVDNEKWPLPKYRELLFTR